jgi:hypothetical protein
LSQSFKLSSREVCGAVELPVAFVERSRERLVVASLWEQWWERLRSQFVSICGRVCGWVCSWA